MPELSKETAALLHYLLPGLLAAWVFYGLTSHEKPSHLERVIQALIFTFLVQAVLPIVQWSLEFIGTWRAICPWGGASETLTSAFIAVLLGASLAYLSNKDSFHKWLRSKGITTRASHPAEWF
jgi:chromate transport protein ChrA